MFDHPRNLQQAGDDGATERMQVLVDRVRLLEDILDRMVQDVMLINADHVVEFCNDRAIELLELPRALMLSRPPFMAVLEHQWSTDEFVATPEEIKAFVRGGGILGQPQRYERRRPNGTVLEVQSVPLATGGVLRTYTDVTERHHSEERIRHRARHDGLTSLLNRETFFEVLTESVYAGATEGLRFAVHYVDLDGFKQINDSLGHPAGDRVLAHVARRMRSVAREQDYVARMGGDEFAILQLEVADADRALSLGSRLLTLLDAPIEFDGHQVQIGASCGIALFPTHGVTADQLIASADSALYRVKSAGGCGVALGLAS